MTEAKIEQLIINSPYTEPNSHWKYNPDTKTFDKVQGRRESGYMVAKKGARPYDDEGRFIEIELVNHIRPMVRAWREAGYPGVTSTTKALLEHWHDNSARHYPFFFCQLDAIETLIFLNETPDGRHTLIPNDGGSFRRICTKLCTGGGKTIVMAMLIAWQVCNKVSYPREKRYSKNILIITPNLTVKKRLEVLRVSSKDSYYSQFGIIPPGFQDKLNQAKIFIHNWQALAYETQEEIAKRKSVDKRGPKSDNAYSRAILDNAQNILVINDEAHHAYRIKPGQKAKRLTKEEKADQQEATVWIEGLDKINRARGIMTCYDFSATPFVPGRGRGDEEGLFGWIVSDFSLNDGIESGLVKTPRVVVRDNTAPDPETYKSKFYHIYADPDVKEDINSPAPEASPLPELVMNAYMLLGLDWKAVFDEWQAAGKSTPPVMITVANRTETAARIEYAFTHGRINIPELSEHLLRIDSLKLEDMNTKDSEDLRRTVDTVGKEGELGEQIRNVISVGMLSEGWDARTVTHIMGLRAFTSQLLCEQVVGRGLRRTSYDPPKNEGGFFAPEYVNVFGIPFTFLPHEDSKGGYVPEQPAARICVLPEREDYKISWPNIVRLEHVFDQKLSLDVSNVPELELDARKTSINADLAPVVDGKTDLSKCSDIDLEKLYRHTRTQTLIFQTAGQVYDVMNTQWQRKGVKLTLLGQVIKLTEDYLKGGNMKITPETFADNPIRRKIVTALNLDRVIRHIWGYITSENTEGVKPVFETGRRVVSTGNMQSWYTRRPSEVTRKSHINRCVFDSTDEAANSYNFDKNPNVAAWVKNDHLGFHVSYLYKGIVRRYIPDFLVRLKGGKMLILEVKGQESEQDRAKRERLCDWVRAVNGLHGQPFGEWVCDVSYNPADVEGIIARHAGCEV